MRAGRILGAATTVLVALGIPRGAGADNLVTVRGQYYREPSTRVVQPVVEIRKDLPAGMDVGAHYLLDAITSASAASGPSGDNIFTEYRSEGGLALGKTFGPGWRVGGAYKYSAESDYWSHFVSLTLSKRVWGDSGSVGLSLGRGWDQVGKRVQGNAPMPTGTGPCVPNGEITCPLDTSYGGLSYTQAISPTLIGQTGYEIAYLDGYQASPYRRLPGGDTEYVPAKRLRNALAARLAKYFPEMGTGLQIHYRLYWDYFREYSNVAMPAPGVETSTELNIVTHTFEGRIYQAISRTLELRITGRYYSQGASIFWCDLALDNSCYTGFIYRTADPKLGPATTYFIEGKVYWDATAWQGVPLLTWFSAGTLELSYGRYIQDTQFGTAHVLQTGYSLPF